MKYISIKKHWHRLVTRPWAGAALAILSGVSTAGLALVLISSDGFGLFHTSIAVPSLLRGPEPTPVPTLTPSLAAGMVAGHMAVAVRLKADSVPLASLHVGAVVDVLASVPEGPDGPGLVGPVVKGVRVLASTPATDHADVLLEAPADAAMLLGHLVRSGLPLTYTVRDAAYEPEAFPVLTLDETRARLSLAPRAIAPPPPRAQATSVVPMSVVPTQPMATEASEVHFVVYAGVDLDGVETRFEVSEAALKAANPMLVPTQPLVEGTELVVPDLFGFAYQVRAEDSLDSLAARFNVAPERVRRVNDLAPERPLVSGERLLIPAPRPVWAAAATGL
jgi:LysM repeat protein